MDIYLTETGSGGRRFTFPSLPERIRVKNSTNYQSFDILSMGTIKIPKGMTPTTISWEGVFFGEAKKKESIVKTWVKPSECEKNVTKLAGKGHRTQADGDWNEYQYRCYDQFLYL